MFETKPVGVGRVCGINDFHAAAADFPKRFLTKYDRNDSFSYFHLYASRTHNCCDIISLGDKANFKKNMESSILLQQKRIL